MKTVKSLYRMFLRYPVACAMATVWLACMWASDTWQAVVMCGLLSGQHIFEILQNIKYEELERRHQQAMEAVSPVVTQHNELEQSLAIIVFRMDKLITLAKEVNPEVAEMLVTNFNDELERAKILTARVVFKTLPPEEAHIDGGHQ